MTSSDRYQLSPSGDKEQEQLSTRIMEYEKLGLKTFEYTKYRTWRMILIQKIISTTAHDDCEYYTEEQFNMNVKIGRGNINNTLQQ